MGTDWGAHTDYMRDGMNSFTLPCSMKIVRGHEVWPNPVTPWYRGYWAEIDEEKAVRVLQHLHSVWAKDRDFGSLVKLKDRARETVVEKCSLPVLRPQLIKALEAPFKA